MKNMKAECAAKSWNKVLALQIMDKKMRSLEKYMAMNLGAKGRRRGQR